MMTPAAMVDFIDRILPHFYWLFYLGTQPTTPPNPSPTTCQPPIRQNISANIWRMKTFEVTILCVWWADSCAMWSHISTAMGSAVHGEAAKHEKKLTIYANKSVDGL